MYERRNRNGKGEQGKREGSGDAVDYSEGN